MCASIAVMDADHPPATVVSDEDHLSLGESRLPPAIALIVFMAINIALRVWLPRGGAIRLPWLVPAVELVVLVLLVLLLTSDPDSVRRRARWLHKLSVTFVCLLVAGALWATTLLVYDLVKGIGETNSPTKLLATGSVVWLGNNLAFALLYWLIDGGGPLARSAAASSGRLRVHPAAEPRTCAAGLEARVSRLSASRLHKRDCVQPNRCDAAHTPREIHDGSSVDRFARALRPDSRASSQRVPLVPRRCRRPFIRSGWCGVGWL